MSGRDILGNDRIGSDRLRVDTQGNGNGGFRAEGRDSCVESSTFSGPFGVVFLCASLVHCSGFNCHPTYIQRGQGESYIRLVLNLGDFEGSHACFLYTSNPRDGSDRRTMDGWSRSLGGNYSRSK